MCYKIRCLTDNNQFNNKLLNFDENNPRKTKKLNFNEISLLYQSEPPMQLNLSELFL